MIIYRCDICGVEDAPGGKVKALSNKPAEGHACLNHYPFPTCGVCSQKLRPFDALKKDWPGTVAKGSATPLRCATHAQSVLSEYIDVSFTDHPSYLNDAGEREYALRYLVRRNATDLQEMILGV